MNNITIINMALRHIGFAPIVSLSDKEPNAVNAALAWEISFREFLGDFNWSFATDWATLLRATNVEIPFSYTYCHVLPRGFERLILVNGATEEDEFEITLSNNVKVFASNLEEVEIKYVRNDFSLDSIHGTALMALVLKIAMHLDVMLNAGTGAKSLIPLAEEFKANAKRHEMTTKNVRALPQGVLNEIRFQE